MTFDFGNILDLFGAKIQTYIFACNCNISLNFRAKINQHTNILALKFKLQIEFGNVLKIFGAKIQIFEL